MSKYDEPHFDTEENIVSVWVFHVNFTEIPENYWTPDFESDNDDDSWDQFSTDFGFGYYGDDSIESVCQDNHSSASIFEQLKFLSYSKSFIKEVETEALKKGIKETPYVFLMYNFKYEPSITKITRSKYMTFIGSFNFDLESEPCELWKN